MQSSEIKVVSTYDLNHSCCREVIAEDPAFSSSESEDAVTLPSQKPVKDEAGESQREWILKYMEQTDSDESTEDVRPAVKKLPLGRSYMCNHLAKMYPTKSICKF